MRMAKGTDIKFYSFVIWPIANLLSKTIPFLDQISRGEDISFLLGLGEREANLKRNPGTQSGMKRTFRIYVRSSLGDD
jgi:hypothetical protein